MFNRARKVCLWVRKASGADISPEDVNELVPQKGKDEEFDKITKKIKELESGLDEELEELQDNLG